MSKLEIVDYSERAIAVFGDTKLYRESLTELKGKFNPFLKRGNDKTPGWIFPKTQKGAVESLLIGIRNGSVKATDPSSSSSTFNRSEGTKDSKGLDVSKKDFMALMSRVESLEQDVAQLLSLMKVKSDVNENKSNVDVVLDDCSEDDNDEGYVAPRLLKRG